MENGKSLSRRSLLGILSVASASIFLPTLAEAQTMPSAGSIQRQLDKTIVIAPEKKLTLPQLKRSQRIRRMAPSIDIQAINFRSGSAQIERGEFWKVDRIAQAIDNPNHPQQGRGIEIEKNQIHSFPERHD